MDNKEFSKQLEKRMKLFAISVNKLSSSLSNSTEVNVIKNQLTKSGTSIGANYREANRSRSKVDFANKIRICENEASETVYWLEIISEFAWADLEKNKLILAEANELLAIFTQLVRALNYHKSRQSRHFKLKALNIEIKV